MVVSMEDDHDHAAEMDVLERQLVNNRDNKIAVDHDLAVVHDQLVKFFKQKSFHSAYGFGLTLELILSEYQI